MVDFYQISDIYDGDNRMSSKNMYWNSFFLAMIAFFCETLDMLYIYLYVHIFFKHNVYEPHKDPIS